MTRIAVAEDNSFLARSLVERLSYYADIQLKHLAPNGKILLQNLEKDKNVDVVLMDIQMPEMDGIDTVLEVKNRYPQIKIIMLTVMDDEDSIFSIHTEWGRRLSPQRYRYRRVDWWYSRYLYGWCANVTCNSAQSLETASESTRTCGPR